jgi:hypothetical protein
MYLKKCTSKGHQYWKIVHGYRDKQGKVKQKVLFNLGKLSPEEVAFWKMLIEACKKPKETVACN